MSNGLKPPTPATVATPATAATPPLLVDAVESARLCGVGRSTWLSLHAQGRVPRPVRLGRRVLWHVTELEAWIAAGCPPRDTWERRQDMQAGTGKGRGR